MTHVRSKAIPRPQDLVREWVQEATDAELAALRVLLARWPDPKRRAEALALTERPTRH